METWVIDRELEKNIRGELVIVSPSTVFCRPAF